jgi:hypothetical protein
MYTEPFIELVKQLVSMGCDPYAKVEKLAFYRELDERKRHM